MGYIELRLGEHVPAQIMDTKLYIPLCCVALLWWQCAYNNYSHKGMGCGAFVISFICSMQSLSPSTTVFAKHPSHKVSVNGPNGLLTVFDVTG